MIKISRRQFLSGVASLSVWLFGEEISRSEPLDNYVVPSESELKRALRDKYSSDSTCRVSYEHKNLAEAYQLIKPTTHTETAIVVWAALRDEPVTNILLEYCRRRSGGKSIMFDHDLLELPGSCLPYTSHILFFREQVQAFVSRIVDNEDADIPRKIWLAQFPFPMGDEICFDKFLNSVSRSYWYYYPDSKDEMKKLYQFIQDSYEMSLPYLWCSSIVEEALRLRNTVI